jgi:hypothetical protein
VTGISHGAAQARGFYPYLITDPKTIDCGNDSVQLCV